MVATKPDDQRDLSAVQRTDKEITPILVCTEEIALERNLVRTLIISQSMSSCSRKTQIWSAEAEQW
jgi:hypothetical protein